MRKPDRKIFMIKSVAATLSLFVGIIGIGLSQSGCSNDESVKPNILLIMADDMGYSDLGCDGSEISTPNIDRLATKG